MKRTGYRLLKWPDQPPFLLCRLRLLLMQEWGGGVFTFRFVLLCFFFNISPRTSSNWNSSCCVICCDCSATGHHITSGMSEVPTSVSCKSGKILTSGAWPAALVQLCTLTGCASELICSGWGRTYPRTVFCTQAALHNGEGLLVVCLLCSCLKLQGEVS